MEKLAKLIADFIGQSLGQDEEKRQVVAYGLAALLQFIVIFLSSILIGIVGNFVLESITVMFSVALLKKSAGGAHSASMFSCTVMSILNITFFAAISRYLFKSETVFTAACIITLIIYILAFILIYKLAPVDTKNKRIVKPEKIKRLRKTAFLTLISYIILSALFLFFSVKYIRLLSMAVSLTFATGWQSFMLTRSGAAFINKADKLFSKNKNNI